MKNKFYDYKKPKILKNIFTIILAMLLCFSLIYNFNLVVLGLRIAKYGDNVAWYKSIKDEKGIAELKNINSNFYAWITCEDVNISLPIVDVDSKKGENFYLEHDFENFNNPLGVPYQKIECEINETTNTVIVGHSSYTHSWFNNKSSHSVFGNLLNYITSSLTNNYIITVETLADTFTYKIFAAFVIDGTNHSNSDILAYTTTNITTQSQFDNFYNTIMELSEIETDIIAQFGDKFLTLFTCAKTNLDNRVIVVAKQITE